MPSPCFHLTPPLTASNGLLVEYCESPQAPGCSGVPTQARGAGTGPVCLGTAASTRQPQGGGAPGKPRRCISRCGETPAVSRISL